tara:strand:+ start:14199 stop:14834 length:636 start_codon:yes stop_codon:yes gene_type:complete
MSVVFGAKNNGIALKNKSLPLHIKDNKVPKSWEKVTIKGKFESKRFVIETAIQAVTAIAVIVGLWLVLLEMRESRENTFVEILQDRLASVTEETTEIFGENLADVLVKACYEPKTLSKKDALVLHNFFTVQMHHVFRVAWIEQLQINTGRDWTFFAAPYLRRILSYPGGVAWLNKHPDFESFDGEFYDFIKDAQPIEKYSCANSKYWVTPD